MNEVEFAAELRANVRRVRYVLTNHRRLFRSIEAAEQNGSYGDPDARGVMAEIVPLLENYLAAYDTLRLAALDRGIRLARWSGEEWEWTGVTWRHK